MAGLIALREPIVNILFQRGVFDYNATVGTAQALLFYSFGIWAIVGVRVVTASFYSMQDTKTPVKIAVIALLTNIIMSLILIKPMKHSGLAFAHAIASSVNFTLLFYLLRKKLGRIGDRRIIKSFLKIIGSSLIMGIAGWFLLHGDLWREGGGVIEKTIYLSGTMAACVIIYLFMSYLLKSEELGYMFDMMKRKAERRD